MVMFVYISQHKAKKTKSKILSHRNGQLKGMCVHFLRKINRREHVMPRSKRYFSCLLTKEFVLAWSALFSSHCLGIPARLRPIISIK